jgi:hypothetical protein
MVRTPRCPYCVSFDQFMPMNAVSDESYLCDKCGHIAIPDSKIFQCPCNHCEQMRAFAPFRPRRSWSASA